MLKYSLFLLSFFTSLVAAQSAGSSKNALPEIGVVASQAISIDKEKLIGDALMRQIRAQAPIINDPVLSEYIQDLGNRLVANADDVKFPLRFFLLNDPNINASAFIGGPISVHTGLIYNADNESELASVLAHEVSHVTQRHIARRILSQQKSGPLQIASAIGAILVGLANPEAGLAALSASNAAAQQSSINYTRSNEKEADRVGMQILVRSGFDPYGSASFFGKLAQKYRFASRPPAFLLTHPIPESRIADARTRAASYKRKTLPPSLNFHLAKSRIRARYFANPVRNIEYFQAELENKAYRVEAAAKYGLALAYFGNEQYKEAAALITGLLEADKDNLFYLDTMTDIAIALKDYSPAIAKLEAASQQAPRNSVLSLNLANILVQAEQYARATQILRDYLLVNPDSMLAHQLLSEAYRENGQPLEMHQSQAEVYAMVSAYPRAIDELHTAYTFADERKLEKQRIKARIEQLKEARERLKSL